MTIFELLETEEFEDCTDLFGPEAYTSVEGNEDSGDEVEQCHPEFSDKEILKALDIASTTLDDRNTDDIAASRAFIDVSANCAIRWQAPTVRQAFHQIIRCILDTWPLPGV